MNVNININKLSITSLLGYSLISVIFLFLARDILLELGVFIFSILYMFKIGNHLFIDTDPTPFAALLILYLYEPLSALSYLIYALPIIDILVGRFNHYSFLNFISILIPVLLFFIIPKSSALVFGIILFNILRILIYSVLRLGPQNIITALAHTGIYSVLGSIVVFFI